MESTTYAKQWVNFMFLVAMVEAWRKYLTGPLAKFLLSHQTQGESTFMDLAGVAQMPSSFPQLFYDAVAINKLHRTFISMEWVEERVKHFFVTGADIGVLYDANRLGVLYLHQWLHILRYLKNFATFAPDEMRADLQHLFQYEMSIEGPGVIHDISDKVDEFDKLVRAGELVPACLLLLPPCLVGM